MFLSQTDVQRVTNNFLKAATRLRRSRLVDQREYPKLVRGTFAGFLDIAARSHREYGSERVEWARDQVRDLIAKEVDLMKREKSEPLLQAMAPRAGGLMTSELDAQVELAHGPHHLEYDGLHDGSYVGRLMQRIRGGPRIRLVPGHFHAIISGGKSVLVANASTSMKATLRRDSPARTNEFRRAGEVWHISYGDEKVSVPNSHGLEYIAQLLRMPGRPIPSTKLEEFSTAKRPAFESAPVMDFEPQETMDEKAVTQYKTRAKELAKEIRDARASGETDKAERLIRELDSIVEHLQAGTGRRGRRRAFADQSERARVRVKNAIDRALRKLGKTAPKTAAHLRASIKTGKSVVYQDHGTPWKT